MSTPQQPAQRRPLRWWPGAVIALGAALAIGYVRLRSDWPFQKRNLTSYEIAVVATILLLLWWTFFSRAANRLRLGITFGCVALALICAATLRIRGVTGDLMPMIEFRWAGPAKASAPRTATPAAQTADSFTNSFPQFYGPSRDGVLADVRLDTNWTAHPPALLWRKPVGAAWSGFAIVGRVAITQEQVGAEECVVALDLVSGEELWRHADATRYSTTIAGEGPRATPTVASNRVLTLGATGILNCLDLATGKQIWSRDVVKDAQGKVPEWGCASSPLVVNDFVIVHGGLNAGRSLFAFHTADGTAAWSTGAANPSYASPTFAELAGKAQLLAFNDGLISSHDPATGRQLWEKPWGNGNVVCSSPVMVSSNRVLFSSGYGVGAELLEISRNAEGVFSARVLWKSIRMKAKFSHLFAREGFLYGLDDGIFACVDLKDGSLRWKGERYGHGQGLVAGENYLLMAESGELVLLRPTPDAPDELARFRAFDSKTWNPPALAGEFLLVRNDREAACLRLKLRP